MSTFPFRMPEKLKAAAAAQAERAGVSMNQYLLAIVATRIDAQAEAERYFALRAARAVPGRAAALLARTGVGQAPEAGDELPPELADRLAKHGATKIPKSLPETGDGAAVYDPDAGLGRWRCRGRWRGCVLVFIRGATGRLAKTPRPGPARHRFVRGKRVENAPDTVARRYKLPCMQVGVNRPKSQPAETSGQSETK